MSKKYDLINSIIENSLSNIWSNAVLEWELIDCFDSGSDDSECTCGKKDIRYIHTIKNKNNNKELEIGSVCIKKFERNDINNLVDIQEQSLKFCQKIKDKQYITILDFSRKLINFLHEYNYFATENDYEFFLKMFNKKDKKDISVKQNGLIKSIIFYQIMEKIKAKNYKIIYDLKNKK